MDCKTKIKELRESTGMNRKEFCKYFQIPYRTVTEWELDNRHAPEYVLRLLEYYIQNEGLAKKKVTDECLELEERGGLHEEKLKQNVISTHGYLHPCRWTDIVWMLSETNCGNTLNTKIW